MFIDNIQFDGKKYVAEACYKSDRSTLITVYLGFVAPSNKITDIEQRGMAEDPEEIRTVVLACLAESLKSKK